MPCLQFAMQGIFLVPHSRWYNISMMEIDMDKRHWEHGPCPKYDCRKDSCKCGLRLISLPAALGDDSKGSPVAPKNGDYCNALVKYESNGHIYVYSTEGVPTLISDSGSEGGHNIVVELENGMTAYPAGTAPISFEDALAAFQNGQSIFLIDHTSRMDDIYTVSAIEAHDGVWSMKVERVGMDLQNDEGFWVVEAHNPTEWRSVDFFKSVIDPATETQVEAVDSKIGDLENLQTTDKDNVVDAINEIVSGGGGGGTSDFNSLTNRPKYNNTTMSSATNIPEVPTRTSDLTNDSGYQTATEVQSAISTATAGKQDTLTAGSNISISGNTISATDTTYTAGNGLDLTGTVFSVDTDVVATQSDLANVTSYITDATEYSASATYAVGDYAIHNGAIYQCNIAIVGGEAWDASHWDAVPSLQEQLDNTETWTFELEGGTTVTKKVVVR